jgi:hypothetical protein
MLSLLRSTIGSRRTKDIMKRKRISGIIDVIECSDPGEIAAAIADPAIDRQFSSRLPLVNHLLLHNVLGILSYSGRRFPTMVPRADRTRAREQEALWHRLNGRAPQLIEGPDELECVVSWLKGTGVEHEIGPLLQGLVGRAFDPSYKANAESWAAAVTLDAAIRMKNPVKRLSWKIKGRVRMAKRLLASKVTGDRAAIHATGVAIHNVVAALHTMRALYTDIELRRTLRQATAPGTVSGCPFKRGTLFVLKLGEAYRGSGDEKVVFQRGGWNQCPAEQWVPALLHGTWIRASRVDA